MTTLPPLHTDTFLPYMRDVTQCAQSLNELNLMWRLIESSGRMNCPVAAIPILGTMAAIRTSFRQMEHELVASLVREKVDMVQTELATKAAFVIDIVVRNLYERTADVGFLATDDLLCRFVAGQYSGDPQAVRRHLRAYRDKYTVYDEIILLDPQGRVLMQLDADTPVRHSGDALLAATLASGGYVETFRATDLRPGKRQALIYSQRMLDPDSGAVVGVLCLSFHFEQEMAGIFATHRDPSACSNMLLIDAAGVVIASAAPEWIAPGVTVPLNRSGLPQVVLHGGRQYLLHTCAAAGYQGYPGPPGWQGQLMTPLDIAFTRGGAQVLGTLEPALAAGLLTHASSFCPPLQAIIDAAQTIRRVVWNGQVTGIGDGAEADKLKVIMEQIGETGQRSNDLFGHSINQLYDTSLQARLRQAECMAALLVDLLDRNLYERANDCRWWAQTPELRRIVADKERDWERTAQIGPMLDFINDLYTVYSCIVVYDDEGVILGCSRAAAVGHLLGQRIGAATLAQVRGLAGEQDYVVTPFEASALSQGLPTYVFHAALRDPDGPQGIVGGIGIVFHARAELTAMLAGALAGRDSMSALLVERDGTVIASTDPAHPAGSRLAEAALLAAAGAAARVVTQDGQYAIRAQALGAGYREFKRSDGYRCDVYAVVCDRLGAVQRQALRGHAGEMLQQARAGQAGARDFATFYVDDALFAVAAEHVSQALPVERLTPVSMNAHAARIGIAVMDDADGQIVWVFDLQMLLAGVHGQRGRDSQIVILEQAGRKVGLLVGALHGALQFGPEQIVPTPVSGGGSRLVPQVIKAGDGDVLIPVLDASCLLAQLFATDDDDASQLQLA